MADKIDDLLFGFFIYRLKQIDIYGAGEKKAWEKANIKFCVEKQVNVLYT